MYTLVSAPVLGFDLVRRPGGAAAAGVLLAALHLGLEDVRLLSAVHVEDDARDAAWCELGQDSDDGDYTSLGATLGTLVLDGEGAPAARRRLERASIGSLGALLRFVRGEVFDWTWRVAGAGDLALQGADAAAAVAVTCDAVATAYAHDRLSAVAQARLRDPWDAVVKRIDSPEPDLGPQTARILRLHASLRGLDAGRLTALRTAGRAEHAVGSWATLVHEASWAAHLSGRTRTAAVAQLMTVQALASAGVTAADSAAGAWNTVSGAVHALVVADLLGEQELEALTEPVAQLVS